MLRTVIVVLALSVLAALPARAEPMELTIVHVNDWDRMEAKDGLGGAARIATVVKDERARAEAEGGLVLVTYGGDLISPSLLSGLDRGAHMIVLANTLKLDAVTLGNHEFDFGTEVLIDRIRESAFPWLAGNISYKGQPGLPGTRQTLLVEKDGYKIGLLGLTTPDTPIVSSPGPDVAFEPMADAARRLAGELKQQGADLIIAMTHEVYTRDLATLRAVPAIDIVVGGHDHLGFAYHDGRQAVMKAGSQGDFVGVMKIAMDRVKGRGGERFTWRPNIELVSTAGLEEDPDMAAKVAAYVHKIDAALDTVIGETKVDLDTRRAAVRTQETAFGNLLADAMRGTLEADVALMNGGGIRGDKVYPAATRLTRKDILSELPFGNRTVKLALSGKALLAALEQGVSDVEKAAGRFPQISGMSFVYDAAAPAGSRVVEAKVGGQPIDPERPYTLASNDFTARGGDGYKMFAEAKVLVDPDAGPLIAQQLVDHIEKAGTVAPTVEGRIVRKN